MPKNNRARTYPRAFSVMVTEKMGTILDMLQVVDSSKDYRASQADITRRLMEKGMAVEALEHALGYATGEPKDIASMLRARATEVMGDELGDDKHFGRTVGLLWAVLCRMWPEVAARVEQLDIKNKPADRAAHQRLLAGPPLTAKGRALTAEEIRGQALADLAAGRVAAPKLTPPRTVQQAQERARLERGADRLAMSQGVSADTLLALSPTGKLMGMEAPDESTGATGWRDTSERGRPRGAADPEAEIPPSPPVTTGEMLRKIRRGEA